MPTLRRHTTSAESVQDIGQRDLSLTWRMSSLSLDSTLPRGFFTRISLALVVKYRDLQETYVVIWSELDHYILSMTTFIRN
jgi:hypothetical protein